MADSSSTAFPTPPVIKSGKEVYDSIMQEIEPELTTENLDTLDEKYEGETKEESKARAERYKQAFVEYKKRYAEYKRNKDEEVRTYGRDLMSTVEADAVNRETNKMTNLESAIQNS